MLIHKEIASHYGNHQSVSLRAQRMVLLVIVLHPLELKENEMKPFRMYFIDQCASVLFCFFLCVCVLVVVKTTYPV